MSSAQRTRLIPIDESFSMPIDKSDPQYMNAATDDVDALFPEWMKCCITLEVMEDPVMDPGPDPGLWSQV